MTKQVIILLCLCSAQLAACSAFDPGSSIVKPRVLGARVEVRGAPERSAPKPEETIDIGWITASRNETQSYRWLFAACLPAAAADGSCASAPLAVADGSGSTPSFSFQVPSAAALNGAESLTVLGLVCDEGSPEPDARGMPRCQGERAHGTNLKLEIELDLNGQGNLNPELDDTIITIDGQSWDSEPSTTDASCADDLMPMVRADGKKRAITIQLGANVRELYAIPDGGRSELEALQISHFSTAGELEQQFSFVEPDDSSERPSESLDWEAPKAKEVPPEGERVRFVFVVRDMRGGVAVTERVLCAVR